MPSSRRSFLQRASAFGLALGAARAAGGRQSAPPAAQPDKVSSSPLLHELELTPFVDELPLPARLVAGPQSVGAGRLRIGMREVHARVHRDLPPTRMWVYTHGAAAASGPSPVGISPLIEARSGVPLDIEWINALPRRHFLPIDYTLHGCGHDVPDVRAVVHVHGARVRPVDDGGPEFWYVPGQSRTQHYPLAQDAATLWYHDHAMGINRLNLYAGLFGMFLLRDAAEDALHLPAGKYELPLLLYDRDFLQNGELFYPTSGIPDHPWVSEFSADALLINGKIRPFVHVEPTTYRLRLVDCANSRFLRLSFAAASAPGRPAAPLPFLQIGSDQGLLAAPVPLESLTVAPGERADLLLDLSAHAGETLYLRNGAFEVMQLRVGGSTAAVKPAALPATLRDIVRMPEAEATVTRRITLNEYQDPVGQSMRMLLNRKHWHEPVTERPKLGSTEIWEFVNLTEDTHPMHFHLVRFQVLDRRPFDRFAFLTANQLKYVQPAQPPAANEMGWKDVVPCDPGAVTRVIVRFEGFPGMYLYHCHIQEHEANDMMRPYEIVA